MTLYNQLFDERFYPATNTLYLKKQDQTIFIGFKVDAQTQIILDCKWKTTDTDETKKRLSLFSEEVIGHLFQTAREMTLEQFREFSL